MKETVRDWNQKTEAGRQTKTGANGMTGKRDRAVETERDGQTDKQTKTGANGKTGKRDRERLNQRERQTDRQTNIDRGEREDRKERLKLWETWTGGKTKTGANGKTGKIDRKRLKQWETWTGGQTVVQRWKTETFYRGKKCPIKNLHYWLGANEFLSCKIMKSWDLMLHAQGNLHSVYVLASGEAYHANKKRKDAL